MEDKRQYIRFRKFLVKSGFVMMQESIYSKIALNTTVSDAVVAVVKRNKPDTGLVQVMVVTEHQFSKIEYIVGNSSTEFINGDERLIIL
jgi:CRISPR-associated protein Cas2